jgi:hypothetical protein
VERCPEHSIAARSLVAARSSISDQIANLFGTATCVEPVTLALAPHQAQAMDVEEQDESSENEADLQGLIASEVFAFLQDESEQSNLREQGSCAVKRNYMHGSPLRGKDSICHNLFNSRFCIDF